LVNSPRQIPEALVHAGLSSGLKMRDCLYCSIPSSLSEVWLTDVRSHRHYGTRITWGAIMRTFRREHMGATGRHVLSVVFLGLVPHSSHLRFSKPLQSRALDSDFNRPDVTNWKTVLPRGRIIEFGCARDLCPSRSRDEMFKKSLLNPLGSSIVSVLGATVYHPSRKLSGVGRWPMGGH
jgi:hypothetical protein